MAKRLFDIDIKEVSAVDEPANMKKFLILKRNGVDEAMNKSDLSPRDRAWNRILDRVDALMEKEPSGGRTREQIVAAFLKTPEGSRLYNAYSQNQDPDEMEKAANTSLRDWAWSVMERMESDEQMKNPSLNQYEILKRVSRSKTYQKLYELYSDPDSHLPAAQAMERISKRNVRLAAAYPYHFGN